ncbi:MAG: RCC1 domain-containing protein [bacterium]
MIIFFRIVLVLLMIFPLSCEKRKFVSDDEIDTGDINETNGDNDIVDDEHTPVCLNEWEQTELIEDVNEFFDFNIAVETGKWNWEKKEEMDELVLDGNHGNIIGVMNDGSLVLKDLNNTMEGYSILVLLHPDGTTTRYILEIDKNKKIAFGNGEIDLIEPFAVCPGYYFDKKEQEILISVTIMTKLKSPFHDEYAARPFIIKIDASGGLSFIAWVNDGTSICPSLLQTDEKIVLFCSHWIPESEIYNEEGKVNAEINIIEGNHIYRKMIKSKYIALAGYSNTGNNNGEIYSFYEENTFTETEAKDIGFIYSFNEKDLCLKIKSPDNFFNELAFDGSPFKGDNRIYPSSFIKKGEYSIVGGVREKLEHFDYDQFPSANPSVYVAHPEKDTIFSFGIKDLRFDIDGVLGVYPVAHPFIFNEPGSNYLFLSLLSFFDMEDEGKDWITAEKLNVIDFLFRPSIVALDMEKNEVYIKNFFLGDLVGFYGEVSVFDNFIYFLTYYGTKATLYRIPKSWLINESSKAKESRFFIENIEELSEKRLKELKPFLAVSTGAKHTCAIDEEGRLICWGDNSKGQLGEYSRPDGSYPDMVYMDGILKDKVINSLKAGASHNCVTTDDYRAYCWGSNGDGRLGIGTLDSKYYPVSVLMEGELRGKKITDIAPGAGHTCAIDIDGKAYCWGRNTLGALGNETSFQLVYEPVAVEMTGALKDRKIIEISSGSGHTCAIADDDGVYCWGSNDRGQLGDGNGGHEGSLTTLGDHSFFPVKAVVPKEKFIKVSAGTSHTCILSDKGKIYCFGNNENGQLGDGTTEMRLTPVALNSDKVFKSVSAGFDTHVQLMIKMKHTAGVATF